MNLSANLRKAVSVIVSASLALSFASYPTALRANAVMSDADKIVGFALSRVGMGGTSNEATLYYNMFGQNVPWDCMFVSYCATACGYASAVPSTIYCYDNGNVPGSVTFFKERDQWKDSSYKPQKGDIVFFDPDNDKVPEKCGFVAAADDTCIYTVEGNTDDYVKQCIYQSDSPTIFGYGTPDYRTAISAPAATPNSGSNSTYLVTSTIGCWLRSSCDYGENKLGVLNTGQMVTVDKENGSWVHIINTQVNGNSAPVSGWAHAMNLKKVTGNAAATTPAAPVITTVTKTTTVTTTQTTTTVPTTTAPTTDLDLTYYISSEIGAWVRSEPAFNDSNKIAILDTDTRVRVRSISSGWAKVSYTTNGGQSYNTGYLHTSVIAACLPVYKVTSPIGCRLRSAADFSENSTIAILDTAQQFEVIKKSGEWLYSRVLLNGNYVYGYIHSSNVTEII